jgi:hypothetical protein
LGQFQASFRPFLAKEIVAVPLVLVLLVLEVVVVQVAPEVLELALMVETVELL